MKELQELRNEILTLRNYGVINKEEEKTLLNKLNAIKEQLRIGDVSSMFSAKQMEQAFNDGLEAEQQRCGEFNIENYC
ncbi:MAG: hypothetical protein HRU26_05780 [Psychroserpens sp.]|nr:hypothetical protein [Psychroserpens sp.]